MPSEPVSVMLEDLQERVDERVRSGAYSSVSEVIRAGLRALDREEAETDAALRRAVGDALADSRPALPADEVFGRLRAHHERRLKAK